MTSVAARPRAFIIGRIRQPFLIVQTYACRVWGKESGSICLRILSFSIHDLRTYKMGHQHGLTNSHASICSLVYEFALNDPHLL